MIRLNVKSYVDEISNQLFRNIESTNINTLTSKVNSDIENIKSSIDTLTSNVKSVVFDLSTKVNTVNENIGSLTINIADIHNVINDVENNISSTRKSLEESITSHNNRLTSVEQSCITLSANIDSNTIKLYNIEESLNDSNTKISNL